MSLPAGLTTRPVYGTYVDVLGTPGSGTVTFTPASEAVVGTTVIAVLPIVATLDATGYFSVPLPCGDDPNLANPLYLKVDEKVNVGANVAKRTYIIKVPNGTDPINLTSLMHYATINRLGGAVQTIDGVAPSGTGDINLDTFYARLCVEVNGAYPPRPASTGPVLYIGPDTPNDAVNGDIHVSA